MTEPKGGFPEGAIRFVVGDAGGPSENAPILPLRVLVIADLLPGDAYNAGASAPAAPIRIDPLRFDDLFARLRPRIAVEVPSVLADGAPVRVDLAPTSLKSFRPDGLCAEVPLLRSLLDGRLVLDRLRDGAITVEHARGEIARMWPSSSFAREIAGLLEAPDARAAAAKEKPPSTGSIDSLLDMADLPGEKSASASAPSASASAAAPAAPAVSGTLGSLIASVAQSGKARGRGARPQEAIARVEKALGAQIGALLQHAEVRRLEQAWRGLRFLVERAKAHAGVRLDVVSARPAEGAATLARVAAARGAEPPVSFAVVDLAIDGTAVSLAWLEAIASAAEEATVPTVLNASPELLGLDDLERLERLDDKTGLFDAPERLPWRAAAARPSLRWVTLALNGALARTPYDRASSRVREAIVHELPDDRRGHVWLAPAWLVGALVLESFRVTGWPCQVVGPQRGGVVADLPVREITWGEGQASVAIPTEVFVSTDTQKSLARAGLLVLASAPNSDAAVVLVAPTAYVPAPKSTYESRTAEPDTRPERVSFGDQLFVARLVQFLRALCSRLPAAGDPADVSPVVEGAVWTLFENAPPVGPEIDVRVARAGAASGVTVSVTVRPRRFLGVTLEEVAFELPLGG